MENEILKNFENNMLNEVLKDIVKQTRIDTLRQVLPEEVLESFDESNKISKEIGMIMTQRLAIQVGYKKYFIENIKQKAKELWGLELNNLNK